MYPAPTLPPSESGPILGAPVPEPLGSTAHQAPATFAAPPGHSPFGVQPRLMVLMVMAGAGQHLPYPDHLQHSPGLFWAWPLWRKQKRSFYLPQPRVGPLQPGAATYLCSSFCPWSLVLQKARERSLMASAGTRPEATLLGGAGFPGTPQWQKKAGA